MCQDQQPGEQMGSLFHWKMSETEDCPALRFLLPTLGTGYSRTCVLSSGGGHSHRTSLKQRGLYNAWKVEVSDGIWCLCIFMKNVNTMWVVFMNRNGEEAKKLLKCFYSWHWAKAGGVTFVYMPFCGLAEWFWKRQIVFLTTRDWRLSTMRKSRAF